MSDCSHHASALTLVLAILRHDAPATCFHTWEHLVSPRLLEGSSMLGRVLLSSGWPVAAPATLSSLALSFAALAAFASITFTSIQTMRIVVVVRVITSLVETSSRGLASTRTMRSVRGASLATLP